MSQVILLASGGLDSTTVAFLLREKGHDVLPIFFDYGQHCVEMEWNRVREVLPSFPSPVERNNISDIFRNSSSRLINEVDLWKDKIHADDLYVPYRTMLFFTVAAARAQSVGLYKVYTGFINSNHAKEIDCTANFMNKLEGLNNSIGPVRFFSPFRYFSKSDVVREALRLGVPIGRTFSCQASSKVPCGACPNCVDRLSALKKIKLLT